MKVMLIILLATGFHIMKSQSLLDQLQEENKQADSAEYVDNTFKTVRLINGHTVETTAKNGLNFIISHRFGEVKNGVSTFFGLDQSLIRLGLEYGLTNRIALGLGRGNYQKLVDTYFKCRLFRQGAGTSGFPLSITLYSAIFVKTESATNDFNGKFKYRLTYDSELIFARKLRNRFSVQAITGFLHRNLVEKHVSQNTVPYLSAGGRALITRRLALTSEYYYLFPGNTADEKVNSLAIGFDIETGGHVFQLHFSNANTMTEKNFIAENTNKWDKGQFHFGFNIIRYFQLK